jgi:hypothetical protein
MNNNIIQLSSYTAPVIVENNKNEWVEYGADNNYYQFLIDRYSNSATNNAVINNICRLIFGQGLTATDSAMKPNEWAQLLSILKEDDLRRIIFDLYALGQCALQIHYDKGHKAITRAFHTPIQLLRPEKCNQDGDIVGYFYSDNWSDPKKYVPKRFYAFGTSKKEVEILYLAPYSAGMKYFSNVDYQGGIDYAYLEEKIAEYLINEVENSFAPTSIVNFNNGTPTDEMKDEISASVIGKLTGSKGKKVVISFNENESTKTTIDTVPLNDAPEHYQYLSDESTFKILRSHNVTTPLLFGVSVATGFSSNADEMKTGALLFENMVIKPKQQVIVEMIKKILSFNGVSLNLRFKTLNPLQGDEPQPVQEVKMSSEKSELELLLDEFGEDIDENYVLIDERDSDYDNEDVLNEYLNEIENTTTKLSLIDKVLNFVSTGTARPTAISSQDKQVKGKMFKVRYKYTGNPNPERAFCKAMMNANKVYRKEDIDRMSDSVVNRGFGEFGADKYDIFRFHGGPRCHHKWSRLTYMLNDKDMFEKIGTRAAEIRGYKVTNPSEVSIYPNNLPLKGYSPRNKNLPSDVK